MPSRPSSKGSESRESHLHRYCAFVCGSVNCSETLGGRAERNMARMSTGLDSHGLLTYYGPTVLCMTLFEKGLHTLEWLVPAEWSRKLSPETTADQEVGGETCCSDLLSVNQRRVLSDDGRKDVVLGIETFTGLQSKVDPLILGGAPADLQKSPKHIAAVAGGPGGDRSSNIVQYGMLVHVGGPEIHAFR